MHADVLEEHEKEIVPHLIGRLFKYFPKLLQSYTGPIIEILVKTIHNPTYSSAASTATQASALSALTPSHSYFLTCNCISGMCSWLANYYSFCFVLIFVNVVLLFSS
jgi:hypothetical protein